METTEEKKKKTINKKSAAKSGGSFLGANKLQISEENASSLIGSIIEKGISDNPRAEPSLTTTAPKPTVLPFPVARHRSHGPHWGPVSRVDVKEEEDDVFHDGEDVDPMKYGAISASANPVRRKQKKGFDLSHWRELVSADNSLETKENDLRSKKKGVHEKAGGRVGNADNASTLGDDSLVSRAPGEDDMEIDVSSSMKVREVPFDDSRVAMELDNLHQHVGDFLDGKARHDERMLGITKAEDEVRDLLVGRAQESPSVVSSSSFNSFGNEQGSATLESEIDVENRARLQQMSPEEIAEAQAEIMEKMSPALINLLKRRGQEKQKSSSADKVDNDPQSTSQENKPVKHVEVTQHSQFGTPNVTTSDTAKDSVDGTKIGASYSIGSGRGGMWNAWTERVEAVRGLRFTLEGTPINELEIDAKSTDYNPDNVAERDFLRTEGDPGAAGYTIKEAVLLTQSVIPGQRALALHLFESILDKALQNMQQSQVGNLVTKNNQADKSVDWEAIWAYALGPEPELILSLRLCLDDNHTSVVLACARVIQCILSCDLNENFFDISEKIATYDGTIFTAPVFRGKPEINHGFLHGSFWKYSAKPSTISTLSEDTIVDETDESRTIQDDLVVAGQDFVAGIVRMDILPRLRYLLEGDSTPALEEYVISILIAIARHSPACANAVIKCQRLVETVVHRFTAANTTEIQLSGIKSVRLMKVLSQSNKQICIDFIKNGWFQIMTQHLYRYVPSLDHWTSSGREYCKLSSALIVEQLRFWRVCIHYGCCISYFPDIFPALCLWLHPPTFDRLHEKNVLVDFASISREAYLVLEALARTLPVFYQQKGDQHSNDPEFWSWNYVSPMVDLAMKWIASKCDPYISMSFEVQEESEFVGHGLCTSSLLWVYSAVMHMLSTVLKKVDTEIGAGLHEGNRNVLWLPEFVPKIGLEIIKNGFLSFICPDEEKHEKEYARCDLFTEKLCHFRQHGKSETALASVCCLHGLVQLVASIDNLIHFAKSGIKDTSSVRNIVSREEKILEMGLLKESLAEMRFIFNVFMKLVESEWQRIQSIEIFGRGGPAPGVGVGWGAPGGGYWSISMLLAQRDVELLIYMVEIIQPMSSMESPTDEVMAVMGHTISSILGVCLITDPRGKDTLEKALGILLQIPVLRYLGLCVQHFIQSNKLKLFKWCYNDDDFHIFNQILCSHFTSRWLSVKQKTKANDGNDSSKIQSLKKDRASLETIHEDSETTSFVTGQKQSLTLAAEWANQMLPLPKHWFLSSISTISSGEHGGLQSPSYVTQVAKTGLFFLLGVESISPFLGAGTPSPVGNVPLVWKLHSLSVALLVGMGVLEDDKSRDVYEILQDFFGQLLDKERSEKLNLELLRFQSVIHDSYSTFIESLVEQFAGESYGDIVFGRQVAIYLHRSTEASVRLVAWSTLSNARVLELLPSLDKCVAEAEGYLQPVEDDENILGAYLKSWISGALDRAATRGSMAFVLALHHLASFIFTFHEKQKIPVRNRLAKSLMRDYFQNQKHEGMMLDFVGYCYKPSVSLLGEEHQGFSLERNDTERRFEILREACDRESTLLREVEKLKSAFEKKRMNVD